MATKIKNDDSKEDSYISKRCKKEKGRDLCLYSSTEFPSVKTEGNSMDLSGENDYAHVKKKYYTNMYMLSKWSKFIRDIHQNDTLDKFCNKMSDGTYIMGVPASSQAIGNVLVALNFENDEIVNPKQGSVKWVIFSNVIDAMDIANYLQISDILVQCEKVINEKFPAEWSKKYKDSANRFFFTGGVYSDNDNGNVELSTAIKAARDVRNKKMALDTAEYFLRLINYLQNRSFDWYNVWPRSFSNKKLIHKTLLAFLLIANKYLDHAKKLELFTKYVKPGDHAYARFFEIVFTAFGKRYDNLVY